MEREELIKQAAEQFVDCFYGTLREVSIFHLLQYAFKCGAEWADRHPLFDEEDNWHTPDEEPQGKNWCILARDGQGLLWTATRVEENIITSSDWDRFVLRNDLIEWTYYEYPRVTFK